MCSRGSPGTIWAPILGAMEGNFGMFFELRSRIIDFPEIMVLLWRGHDFQGFGGLANHHFRLSKASKKASDEIWVLGQKKIDKKTFKIEKKTFKIET